MATPRPCTDDRSDRLGLSIRYFWKDRLLQSSLHPDPTDVRIGSAPGCEFDPADSLRAPEFRLVRREGRQIFLQVPRSATARLTCQGHTAELAAGGHPLSPTDTVRVEFGYTRAEIEFRPLPPRVRRTLAINLALVIPLVCATSAAGYIAILGHSLPVEHGLGPMPQPSRRVHFACVLHQHELRSQRTAAMDSFPTAGHASDQALSKVTVGAINKVSSYGLLKATGQLNEGRGPLGNLATVFGSSQENTEAYRDYGVNDFVDTVSQRLSTFAIDVDTASYSLAKRKLLEGSLPQPESVRVEEFLNAFSYEYPGPDDGPFAVHFDAAPSPYDERRHLLRIGVQARRLAEEQRSPAHLTFLVDVSGSMSSPDKLPMVKQALSLLVRNLKRGDTVAIVSFADWAREILPPTGVEQRGRILEAIERLHASGSTAMAAGLVEAYKTAGRSLAPGSISRVIMLSDGDANVGPTQSQQMLSLVRAQVLEGVTLTTVGLGTGNYQDVTMEQLADKGNGNYHYVGSLADARKIFDEQLGGTLQVVAKDVKIQVAFNSESVRRYRLVGYENRALTAQQFRDDQVDAGEIGAGHSVTAIYEVELDPRRGAQSLATVRVRSKTPRGEGASEQAFVFSQRDLSGTFEAAPTDLRFAAGVMGVAEMLRHSPHAQGWRFGTATRAVCDAAGGIPDRVELCNIARSIAGSGERLALGY
jgi:Ca-activated chloride channel family protein